MEQNNEYVKTGYTELDEALCGGFKRGDLILLASRPGMGKTTLALNITNNCSNKDNYVSAIFSMEMFKEQLSRRILCIASGVKIKDTLKWNNANWEKLEKQTYNSKKTKIIINDNSTITIDKIVEECHEIKIQYGLDLVVIDYVDLIAPYISKGVLKSKKIMLEYITNKLKGVARELNIAVVILTQLSRKVAYRKNPRPVIDDIMDEQEALKELSDIILFIYNPKRIDVPLAFGVEQEDYTESVIELSIAKTTHGESKVINLKFLKDYLKFENYQKQI